MTNRHILTSVALLWSTLVSALATAQADIFIGTLAVEGGHVVLTRCDLAETRYILHDTKRSGPVSRFAAAGGKPAYGEVVGSVSEAEGQYVLSVTAIDNMVVGKSCHLLDALDATEQTPPPDSTPISPDLSSLIECRSDVATALRVRNWLENDPPAASAAGIMRVPTTNFIGEYRLAKPITIWGHATPQLALHPDGFMAILDDVSPEKLAADHHLERMLPPPNFMATKTVQDTSRKIGKATERTIISQSVSTRDGLPAKTIVGCIYVSSGPEDIE